MFFYEAADVFWSTCTMIFNCFRLFRSLMATNQEFLGRLTKIRIVAAYEYGFTQDWGNVINNETIALLKGLKGVELEIARDDRSNIFIEKDVTRSKEWLKTGIPKIIRAFRQHKLEEKRVVVVFMPRWQTNEILIARMKHAADRIRGQLLAHEPLREARVTRRKRYYEEVDSGGDE
jgi:hypothetical protein